MWLKYRTIELQLHTNTSSTPATVRTWGMLTELTPHQHITSLKCKRKFFFLICRKKNTGIAATLGHIDNIAYFQWTNNTCMFYASSAILNYCNGEFWVLY